jgi:hypothetical protein
MIKVIYGKRGSGKTKRIIAMAKEEAAACKGHVVFLEKDNRCMLDLPHEIRYVNAGEYSIKDPDVFYGFVSGMLAANFDIVDVFIDALPSIIGLTADVELENFFNKLRHLSEQMQVNMIMSVSAGDGPAPAFLEPYIITD